METCKHGSGAGSRKPTAEMRQGAECRAYMKYFDDMKYEDIAEVLDVAVGTLKATYHNAVKKIEESLKISDTLPSFE